MQVCKTLETKENEQKIPNFDRLVKTHNSRAKKKIVGRVASSIRDVSFYKKNLIGALYAHCTKKK